MATDFSALGMDPDEIRIDLQALGIDDSVYTDAELESLALAANLMLLQAISDKSTEIEQDLASYQTEVDKTSGMQESLNNLREHITDEDATAAGLLEFVTTDVDYMAIDDASSVVIDHVVTSSGGTSVTVETLGEYITALENKFLEYVNDEGETGFLNIITAERDKALSDGVIDAYNTSSFLVYRDASGDTYDYYQFSLSNSDFKDYLVAKALQDAGFIGEDVYLDPVLFASYAHGVTTENVLFSGAGNGWIPIFQDYYGKITIEYDADDGTVDVAYNGTAALAEMGIDFEEYFRTTSDTTLVNPPEPLASEEMNMLLSWVVRYASNWQDGQSSKKIVDNGIRDDEDIDTLLQATATSIESQSTKTEVALLTVNSGITEWGELNDVWDLVHEYVQDALKRASDNVI